MNYTKTTLEEGKLLYHLGPIIKKEIDMKTLVEKNNLLPFLFLSVTYCPETA